MAIGFIRDVRDGRNRRTRSSTATGKKSRRACVRSRRPLRYANYLPQHVDRLIGELKRNKPYWGARKIRGLLVRKLAGDVRVPARSTVHAVLDRSEVA